MPRCRCEPHPSNHRAGGAWASASSLVSLTLKTMAGGPTAAGTFSFLLSRGREGVEVSLEWIPASEGPSHFWPGCPDCTV